MAKLSVWMPIKPLIVNQAFGIYNTAYIPLGFSRHNGVDMAVYDGEPGYAMMDAIVIETGENSTAGKYVKLRSVERVEAEGRTEYVCLMYMHGKQILVHEGMQVKAGDKLMLCDNTGFSTGHHLHVSAFFCNEKGVKKRIGNADTAYCFDFMPYWNKYYAIDAQKVLAMMHQLIALLQLWLSKI